MSEAKKAAQVHLKSVPNDVDVMLLLGMIYYQEKNYSSAKEYALKVIKKVPGYADARVLLIRVLLATNDIAGAKAQLKKGLTLSPNYKELKLVAIQLNKVIKEKSAPIKTVEEATNENCADKIMETATCFYKYRQYFVAAAVAKDALVVDPTNKKAKGLLDDIKSVSKKYLWGVNEFEVYSENDRVSDLKEWWNFTTFAYRQYTRVGAVNAFVNYTKRFGIDGTQEEILLAPILSRRSYFELDVGFSDRYALFPRYFTRIEAYFDISNFLGISLGEYYAELLLNHYSYTTASITKETANIFMNFRVFHYVTSSGDEANLGLISVRKYINKDNDHYLWTKIGFGRSPDLNDLAAENFIIIRNYIYYLGYHFPVTCNRIAFNIGVDYQKQIFPTGRVRLIKGGLLDVTIRF